jgi:hypothetical protein
MNSAMEMIRASVDWSRKEFCEVRFEVSPILVTLMNEALSSSETSVLTRATQRNIPEDTILHSQRRENLKSYRVL